MKNKQEPKEVKNCKECKPWLLCKPHQESEAIRLNAKVRHTPTPWEVAKDDAYYIRREGDAMGPFAGPICMIETGYVLLAEQKANAAFIVQAVNAYGKDQETIKEFLEIMRWLIAERDAGTDKGLLPDGLLNRVRIAIQKTEEN